MSSCRFAPLGRAIYLTSQTMRNHLERILKPYDLTGEQFHLLRNMAADQGCSQREICGVSGKSPANITRILDRLVKKDLVFRSANPDDRRSSLVFRTAHGERLVTEVTSLFSTFSTEIEQGIEPADLAVFRKVLTRIDANLTRLSDQPGE